MTIATLNDLMQSQTIDPITYIDLYPDNAMPFKSKLKRKLKEREESENMQLKVALMQAQEQIKAMAQQLQYDKTVVQQAAGLVNTIDELKNQVDRLKVEGTAKILEQNAVLKQLQARNQEVTQDAKTLAQMVVQKQ